MKSKGFPANLPQARAARVFYFCGPDEAGAADALQAMSRLLGPAERVDLAGAELRRDPVRLADEARSVSLFGDARQIHIRSSGDEVHDAVEILLESPVDGWPVLIHATSATDKSRVAKLLENRADSLVAMFYQPDLKAVTNAVRDMAGPAGLRITDDLAERIAQAAALDTRVARSELEKLALFLDADAQAPRTADRDALDAIVAVSEDDGFAPLVNAVLGGDVRRLAPELARMRELGLNPVGLLLALERRAAQLAQLSGRLGPRGDMKAFLEQEKTARRMHFRDLGDIAHQLPRWRGRAAERLVSRLLDLHRALLADSQNAERLLAHGLAEIARAAGAARRR